MSISIVRLGTARKKNKLSTASKEDNDERSHLSGAIGV